MTELIIGLAVFMTAHFFPRFRQARRGLMARIGEGGYKLAYTAVSLISMVLLVRGYMNADFIAVYEPSETARSVAHAAMPFAFLMLAGSQIPSNLKRFVRHPLSWATLIWAATHLIANGDLASVILFGAFGAFAIASMTIISATETASSPPERPRINDLLLIVVALVGYGATIWAHGEVFGVYVVG